MATVFTFAERDTLLSEIATTIDNITALNNDIKDYRDAQQAGENSPSDALALEGDITNMMAELSNLSDRAVVMMGLLTYTYDNTVAPSAYSSYTSCGVVVDNGASKGVLTATGSDDWFNVFDAGDTVEISNSENSNDGTYTVDSKTGTTLTLTSVLAGTDNADDESITVTLKAR